MITNIYLIIEGKPHVLKCLKQFASLFCFALLSLIQRDELLGPQVGEKQIRERGGQLHRLATHVCSCYITTLQANGLHTNKEL